MNREGQRTQLGQYKLLRRLSIRGTSEVYLGTSDETGESSILRILRAETTASLVIRDRVLKKAEIAKSFSHPSLVPDREVIRDGREITVVRDFIDGSDLSRVAQGYRSVDELFPASGALLILMELLDALAYLQKEAERQKGDINDWFHGGLTSRNVFITSEGELRITGFGYGELGVGESSVEAWKGRRMNAMSPRWICAGHMEQEEDLFAAGSLVFGLLTGGGVYGALDTSSPEELKTLAGKWSGLDVDSLAERLGSMSLAAVIKRLTSPRPGANFPSASEALHALRSLINPISESDKRKILRGLLDGSEKDGMPLEPRPAQEQQHHPVGEGGATRSILEAGGGHESLEEGAKTLRGASVDSLGEDFADVKRKFGVLKSDPAIGEKAKPRARPQLKKSAGRSSPTALTDETLDIDGGKILGGQSEKRAVEATIDIHEESVFPDGLHRADGSSSRDGGTDSVQGREDRTVDIDSKAIFQEKNGQTVVRLKTPSPSQLPKELSKDRTRDEGRRSRVDSKVGWEQAVLAEKLPPISQSTTFRLLVVALSVLFLLIGLLIFLWIRKMDVIRYTTDSEVAVVDTHDHQGQAMPSISGASRGLPSPLSKDSLI